jgi:hypothetical protein
MDVPKEYKKCICGKKAIAKGLCDSCYKKEYRKTNKSKITTKKYYEKLRQNKPPKEIKKCQCGNNVIAKGLCEICYRKEYYIQKKIDNPKPLSKIGRPKNSLNKKEKEKIKLKENITDIRIHPKNKGHYFHKARLGQSLCKSIAFKDISKECGKDKFYSMNYLGIESQVLSLKVFDYEIKDTDLINTKKY